MQPLVSILIPAYNAEPWICEAVESALAQTWANKEIIVVDDGSKDKTLLVARQFESRGVRVVSQANQGASTARNHALSLCKGDYIQWLDADDFLAPDKIALQLAAIDPVKSPDTLLSSAWCRFYFRPQRSKFVPTSQWQDLSPTEWMLRKMENNEWMAIETWLISRYVSERAGLWDTSLSMDDDGEYFSRILRASDRVVFVPQAKSFVRRGNPGSLSQSLFSHRKLQSQFLSSSRQIQVVRSLDDQERTKAACLKYLQRWYVYFYPEHEDLILQANALARELGGTLYPPVMNWKYRFLKNLVGTSGARKASQSLPTAKAKFARRWDWLLSKLNP